MAITTSAKKAYRASLRKQIFNMRRKRALASTSKIVRKLIETGKKADAQKSLAAAYQAIDKATKNGVIKKNTAARKKSRLAKALGKLV